MGHPLVPVAEPLSPGPREAMSQGPHSTIFRGQRGDQEAELETKNLFSSFCR